MIAAGTYQIHVLTEMLSMEEKMRLERLFQSVDVGGDGTLNPMEIRALFSRLGHPAHEWEIKSVMRQIDTDKNGFISWDEFASNYMALINFIKSKIGPTRVKAKIERERESQVC
jgi:Ca2+-binding EF-hand superfamily protein